MVTAIVAQKSHRQAFGPHNVRTPAQKARAVALSIAQRDAEGRAWSWADYGLTDSSPQVALVVEALAALARRKAV